MPGVHKISLLISFETRLSKKQNKNEIFVFRILQTPNEGSVDTGPRLFIAHCAGCVSNNVLSTLITKPTRTYVTIFGTKEKLSNWNDRMNISCKEPLEKFLSPLANQLLPPVLFLSPPQDATERFKSVQMLPKIYITELQQAFVLLVHYLGTRERNERQTFKLTSKKHTKNPLIFLI